MQFAIPNTDTSRQIFTAKAATFNIRGSGCHMCGLPLAATLDREVNGGPANDSQDSILQVTHPAG